MERTGITFLQKIKKGHAEPYSYPQKSDMERKGVICFSSAGFKKRQKLGLLEDRVWLGTNIFMLQVVILLHVPLEQFKIIEAGLTNRINCVCFPCTCAVQLITRVFTEQTNYSSGQSFVINNHFLLEDILICLLVCFSMLPIIIQNDKQFLMFNLCMPKFR